MLKVEEAQGTGVLGADGSGIAGEEGLVERIDILMGTFSKALGSFGAYAACSKRLVEYFINFCRSFIYSTALPGSVLAANLEAIEIIKDIKVDKPILIKQEWLDKIGIGNQTLTLSNFIPTL